MVQILSTVGPQGSKLHVYGVFGVDLVMVVWWLSGAIPAINSLPTT